MCKKLKFNVIETNKTNNVEDITKYINTIINNLIVKEYFKTV